MKSIGYSLSIASGILFSSAAVLAPIPNLSTAIATEIAGEDRTQSEDLPALSLFLDETAIADPPLEWEFSSETLFFVEESSSLVQIAQTPAESERDSVSTSENEEIVEDTETEIETETEETEEAEGEIEETTGEGEIEENEEEEKLLEISEEERATLEILAEGDRLFLAGEISAAVDRYQEGKEPFQLEEDYEPLESAFYDEEQLSPAGGVYWRIHQEGLESGLNSKIFAPAGLLVEEQPGFIPGYLSYSSALIQRDRLDDAIEVLSKGAVRYPGEPDLIAATVAAEEQAENWLSASLTARQFSVFNPDHPRAEEFLLLAEENWGEYQGELRSRITKNAILNLVTGTAGFLLTGNPIAPLSALQMTAVLLQGEDATGDIFARRIVDRAPMLWDEEVLDYVREIGYKLASTAGRDEFNYEFYVIMDETLNAFALPGGKIFVHAGAIVRTHSEAELAGLLAHEISHAVMSHGFELATRGNLTASITGYIPFVGGLTTNLIVFSYSRDMERQADALGTRILATSGYAADGMRNLMIRLDDLDLQAPPEWLSTHPDTEERIRNLEGIIIENDYNRYAFEGVERHTRMRERVADLLEEYKANSEED
ncbi:MAG: M48 family metallopeptidase [Cyanobacteria bacterium P01_E01_bin.42]